MIPLILAQQNNAPTPLARLVFVLTLGVFLLSFLGSIYMAKNFNRLVQDWMIPDRRTHEPRPGVRRDDASNPMIRSRPNPVRPKFPRLTHRGVA